MRGRAGCLWEGEAFPRSAVFACAASWMIKIKVVEWIRGVGGRVQG